MRRIAFEDNLTYSTLLPQSFAHGTVTGEIAWLLSHGGLGKCVGDSNGRGCLMYLYTFEGW